MNSEMLQALLVEQLGDIYDAEKQLVKVLPSLAKAAESQDLEAVLRTHLDETETHVARLEEVFEVLGAAANGNPCKGMKGLIEEGNEAIHHEEEGSFRDLAIIAGGQKVKHYEMSAYGTARTLALQLQLDAVAELLRQTENEQKHADERLTEIATTLYGSETGQNGKEKKGLASSSSKPKTRWPRFRRTHLFPNALWSRSLTVK